MSDGKLEVSPEAASLAAYFLNGALMMRLIEKGVLTPEEGTEIAAMGASLCRGNGSELAANMIEATFTSAAGVDPIEAARNRGYSIRDDG